VIFPGYRAVVSSAWMRFPLPGKGSHSIDSKKSLRGGSGSPRFPTSNGFPGWGEERIYEMIEKTPGLVASLAQRFWGRARSSCFFCDACGAQLKDFAALRNVVEWFKKEGADAWYQHSPEELFAGRHKVFVAVPAKIPQRERHFGCLVRFRLIESRGSHS